MTEERRHRFPLGSEDTIELVATMILAAAAILTAWAADAALQANLNPDNHVLTAVALALALFFAGVSSKLKVTRNSLVAIALAAVVFTGAGLVLLFLPRVSPF